MAHKSSRRAAAAASEDESIDFAAGWCTTGPVSDARSAANRYRCGAKATGTMRQKGRAPARAQALCRSQKAGREAPLSRAHGFDGAYLVAASYISATWSQLMRLSKNALR